MYALNDQWEIIFEKSGNKVQDIVPGSMMDISIRYQIKFGKKLENNRFLSAIPETGKNPHLYGIMYNDSEKCFTYGDKSCYDPELLSSYAKIAIRRNGILLKPYFDMGYRNTFANMESLKVIHDYINASDYERSTQKRFALLWRRETLAKIAVEEKLIHFQRNTQKETYRIHTPYMHLVNQMHGCIPPLFEKIGKEVYADTMMVSSIDGDPKKIKLPFTGQTKSYTVFFPNAAQTRQIEIVKLSILFHTFPSKISKDVMEKSVVHSIKDQILWDEGKSLAQKYLMRQFDKMTLSVASIAVFCIQETSEGEYIAYSPYAGEPTRQLTWQNVRYPVKTLAANIFMAGNWLDYMNEIIVTPKNRNNISNVSELPRCETKILPVNDDTYILRLGEEELFPMEELDLIENLPLTEIENNLRFKKGTEKNKLVLNKFGMQYVMEKYRLEKWQM